MKRNQPRIQQIFTKNELPNESLWPRDANFENIEELQKETKKSLLRYGNAFTLSQSQPSLDPTYSFD
jgi:hypothetical protein